MTEAEPRRDRALWQGIFGKVKPLVEDALDKAGIGTASVRWTDMRWDLPDITAAWPEAQPTRNIHVWIRRGDWPRFFLEAEGAVWEDDEENRERRWRPVSFEGRSGVVRISGTASQPVVSIENQDDFQMGLVKLAEDVKATTLDTQAARHPLQPDPLGKGGVA